MALENIRNHFTGLPMENLIGAPLRAACDAQVMLARSTVDFIRDVGFDGDKTRTADFSYTRHKVVGKDVAGNDIYGEEKVGLEVPVLSIVNIPSLMVDDVNITFDMEVKSSETSKSEDSSEGQFSSKTRVGMGFFSVSATVNGSVSSHRENTRSSDNSAKYHVEVNARQGGTPEGLMRVLDIISESVAPKSVEDNAREKLNSDAKTEKEAVESALKAVDGAKLEVNTAERKLDIEKAKYELLAPEEIKDDDKKKVPAAEEALVNAKKALLDKEISLADAYDALNKKMMGVTDSGQKPPKKP